MTETEYIIYTITGIVAVVVGRLCYVRIYKNGKSRKQRRAERWKAQGGVAQGTLFGVDLLRAGDPSLEGEDLQEDLYRVKYHYSVHGMTYTASLRFLSDYPRKITVFYDPEKPEDHIAANEITEVARRNRGCLLSILLTFLAIGLCGNLLRKLFLG